MRTFAPKLVVAGVVSQVAGLAVDVWLHARDPGLAAHEGVLSWRNPGHALLGLGLGLVVAGAAALVDGRPDTDTDARPRRPALTAIGLAVVVVVGSASAAVAFDAAAGDDHPEPHSAASATSSHGDAEPAGAEHAATEHGTGPSLPVLSAEERATLDTQLAASKAAAAAFPTLADARAAGFEAGTPYESLIGAHYIDYGRIDERFDPAEPEMLLYDGDRPESRIVGATYYVIAPHAPDGFAGRADHWHQHLQTCITDEGPVFAGDGYKRCRASGRLSWMLHAWVVPGFESPQGVFSGENIRLP
ncbi:MAG TPA: hypothetical protein VF230_01730 [Acidimicrobiales bacterium]